MNTTHSASKPAALQRWRNRARRGVRAVRLRLAQWRHGRPAGLLSMPELRRGHPAWWASAVPASGASRVAPVVHGHIAVDFSSALAPIPELGVVTIPGGFLFGSQGWVFTPRRQFLADTSWYGDQARTDLLPRAFPRATPLRGTCLSLASDFAKGNYGHYLLDCLSRLELFKRGGGDIATVDHVYLPKPPSRSAQRLLESMGIPLAKCLWAEDASWIQADVLVATSFPGLKRNYPAWLPASLQQYAAAVPYTGARVYIPRNGVRKAVNEAQLIAIAAEFGFQAYDFEKCADEPSFFSTLGAVVGPHGAGMTNLAFCRPGTKVLELMPSDHVHPYFYTVAESAQLEYHCLAGQSQGTRPADAFGPSPFDFAVDPAEFRAALVAMKLDRA